MNLRYVLVALLVPACSLITNLGDLAPDAAPADVTAEDVTREDAIADGGPPPRYCATVDAYALCDDFEEDGSFVPPWTNLSALGGASLVRASADSGCIEVSLGAGDAGPGAWLTEDFFTKAQKIHYAFDLQIVAYATPPNATSNVNEIGLPLSDAAAAIEGDVFLSLSASSTKLVEQHRLLDGGYSAMITLPFTPPSPGVWRHYDVVVDLGSGSVALSIDGADAGSLALPNLYTAGAPSVAAGATFESAFGAGFQFLLDDAAVWLE